MPNTKGTPSSLKADKFLHNGDGFSEWKWIFWQLLYDVHVVIGILTRDWLVKKWFFTSVVQCADWLVKKWRQSLWWATRNLRTTITLPTNHRQSGHRLQRPPFSRDLTNVTIYWELAGAVQLQGTRKLHSHQLFVQKYTEIIQKYTEIIQKSYRNHTEIIQKYTEIYRNVQ